MNYDTLINAGIVLAVLLALGLLGARTERHRGRAARTSRITPLTPQEIVRLGERRTQQYHRLDQFTQIGRVIAYVGIPLGTILFIGIDETVDFVVRWWRPLAFLLLAVWSGLTVFYIGQYVYAKRTEFTARSIPGQSILPRSLILVMAVAATLTAVGISAYEIFRASFQVEVAATFVLAMNAAKMTLLGGGLVGAARLLGEITDIDVVAPLLFFSGLGILAYGFYLFVSS